MKNSIFLGKNVKDDNDVIMYSGNQNVLTIGVNSQGNHNNIISKNLLNYKGSLVILDVDGVFYKETNKKRLELENKIIRIDPFKIIDDNTDKFNPLDNIQAECVDLFEEARELVDLFSLDNSNPRYIQLHNLLLGLIQSFISNPQKSANLYEIVKLLNEHDVKSNLSSLADKSSDQGSDLINQILGMKDWEDEETIIELKYELRNLNNDIIGSCINQTSFNINEIFTKNPTTVYIILPEERLKSHQIILKLWVGSFITITNNIKGKMNNPVLFLLEYIDSLGRFNKLENLLRQQSLLNIKFWTFWNSIRQVKEYLKKDWIDISTISGVVQFIGLNNRSFQIELEANLKNSFKRKIEYQNNEQIILIDEELLEASSFDDVRMVKNNNKLESNVVLGKKMYEEGSNNNFLTHFGNGNICTVSTLSSDSKEELIVENLINNNQSIIVLDLDGVYYSKIQRKIDKSNRNILRLDPFNICGESEDTFNPFDILQYANNDVENIIEDLLYSLVSLPTHSLPFWDIQQYYILQGIIKYLHEDEKKRCNLEELQNVIFNDDLIYNLAVILDTIGKRLHPNTYTYIANFLQEADKTRNAIIAGMFQYVEILNDSRVKESIGKTSFNLNNLFSNTSPLVFVIFPTSKFTSHQSLLKFWLRGFASFINCKKAIINSSVLLMLDSLHFQQIRPHDFFSFSLNHSKIKFWIFWNSIIEIQQYYNSDWVRFMNNIEVLQFLDFENKNSLAELSFLTGLSIPRLEKVNKKNQLLIINHELMLNIKNFDQNSTSYGIKTRKNSSYILLGKTKKQGKNYHFVTNSLFAKRNGSLFTIANRIGKKRESLILKNLYTNPQTKFILDIDGVYFSKTEKQTVDSLNKIVKLDPFRLCGAETDTFNPFDIVKFLSVNREDYLNDLVYSLFEMNEIDASFWTDLSKNLIYCSMFYLLERGKLTPFELRNLLIVDTNNILTEELEKSELNPQYKLRISEFLKDLEGLGDKSKSKIVDGSFHFFKELGTPTAFEATSSTSFEIKEMLDGEISTIFLIMPASKIKSHQNLIRLWIGAFTMLFTDAPKISTNPLLLILENINRLKGFDYLKNYLKMPFSSNIQFWIFWDNIIQFKEYFGDNWESTLKSGELVQFFDLHQSPSAKEVTKLFNSNKKILESISENENLLFFNKEINSLKLNNF